MREKSALNMSAFGSRRKIALSHSNKWSSAFIWMFLLAIALFSTIVSANYVEIQEGKLNVSSNFTVDVNVLVVDSNSNRVGVGTLTPEYELHVVGSSNISGALFTNVSSCDSLDTDANGMLICGTDASGSGGSGLLISGAHWTYLNGSANQDVNVSGVMFVNASTGRVGIGTLLPSHDLNVLGSANITEGTFINVTSCDSLDTDADGKIICGSDADSGLQSDSAGIWIIGSHWTYLNGSAEQDINLSGILFVNQTNGSVGLGTLNPSHEFNVIGSVNITGDTYINISSCDSLDTDSNGRIICGTDASGGSGGSGIFVDNGQWSYVNDTVTQDLNLSDLLFINATSQKVGIGIATPAERFSIQGSNISFKNTSGDIFFYLDNQSGNVGIGTINPAQELHVVDGEGSVPTFNQGNLAVFQNNDGAADQARVSLIAGDAATAILQFGKAAIDNAGWIMYSHTSDQMDFRTANTSGQMVLSSLGHLGIGTTAPAETLTVRGNVTLNATLFSTAGRVGIGRASTSQPFEVYDAAVNTVAVFQSGDSVAKVAFMDDSTASNSAVQIGAEANDMTLTTGSTEIVRLTSEGQVGVGDTNPGSTLTVLGDTNPLVNISANSTVNTVLRLTNDIGTFTDFRLVRSGGAQPNKFFINQNGTAVLTIDSDFNVGIGKAAPASKLDVDGDINISGQYLGDGSQLTGIVASSAAWNRSGSNVFLSQTGDSVGIGNVTPQQTLHVQGTIVSARSGSTGYLGLFEDATGSEEDGWDLQGGANFILREIDDGSTTGTRFYIEDGGNVGIGTTGPGAKLDVEESTNAWLIQFNNSHGRAKGLQILSGSNGSDPIFSAFRANGSQTAFRVHADGNIMVGTNSPSFGDWVGGSGSGLEIENDGAYPTIRLDNTNSGFGGWFEIATGGITKGVLGVDRDTGNGIVSGAAANATILTTTGAWPLHLGTQTSVDMTIETTGYIGIGTSSPLNLTHLAGDSADSPHALLMLENTHTPTSGQVDSTVDIDMYVSDEAGNPYLGGRIRTVKEDDFEGPTSTYDAGLAFWTRGDHTAAERVRIDENGNVGIGTPAPASALDIVGNLNISGQYFGDGSQLTGIVASSTAWNRSAPNIFLAELEDWVGIGTADTESPLQIVGINGSPGNGNDLLTLSSGYTSGTGGQMSIIFGVDNDTNIGWIEVQEDQVSNDRDLAINTLGGSVGIGTTTPGRTLHVNETGTGQGLRVSSSSTTGQGGIELRSATSSADNTMYVSVYGAEYAGGGWFGIGAGSFRNYSTLVSSQASNGFIVSTADLAPLMLGTNDTERIRVTSEGNMGVGTSTPKAKLTVEGNSGSAIEMLVNNSGGHANLLIDRASTSFDSTLRFQTGVTGEDWLIGTGLAAESTALVFYDRDGETPRMVIHNNTGYVGIGTANPAHSLSVVGDVNISGQFIGDGSQLTGVIASSTAWNRSGSNVFLSETNDNVGIGTDSPSRKVKIQFSDADTAWADMEGMMLQNDDTTTDSAAQIIFNLGLSGTAQAGIAGVRVATSDSALAFYTEDSDSITEKMRISETGNIGVGITDATDVNGNAQSGTIVNINSSTSGILAVQGSQQARLFMVDADAGTDLKNWMLNSNSGELRFQRITDADGDGGIKLLIDANDYVGIGTSSPNATLHVNGTVEELLTVSNESEQVFKVTNNGSVFADRGYNTPAADVAERFPSSDYLEPGDVVVIDLERDESVKKSTLPNDTLVAGIISTEPGIKLGKEGYFVALAGRVPVKVVGDVQRGDLLVTSDEAGHARACEDAAKCAGAILGKALTNNHEGQVVALVSLQ